eukprot:1156855-Pelagomonas_calceolata.AAC.2
MISGCIQHVLSNRTRDMLSGCTPRKCSQYAPQGVLSQKVSVCIQNMQLVYTQNMLSVRNYDMPSEHTQHLSHSSMRPSTPAKAHHLLYARIGGATLVCTGSAHLFPALMALSPIVLVHWRLEGHTGANAILMSVRLLDAMLIDGVLMDGAQIDAPLVAQQLRVCMLLLHLLALVVHVWWHSICFPKCSPAWIN